MDSRSASRPFPGFSHLYDLHEPGAVRAYRATLDLEGDEDVALFLGEAKRTTPIRGHWAMGAAKPTDLVWTTLATPAILSERVVSILREGNFSGWDVVPVELRDKAGELMPTYHYLCIHGRSGRIQDDRSVKMDKIYPGGVFPAWFGIFFDEGTWDGSDFFVPEGTTLIGVTEPVKRAFEKTKVRNVRFQPLDQAENVSLKLMKL